MAEYIEREKAIECIRPHVKPTTVYGEGYMQAIEHAVDILELLPTADVQPVRRGHWIEVDYGMFVKCSECGNISEFEHNYCDECGADMRGEGNA